MIQLFRQNYETPVTLPPVASSSHEDQHHHRSEVGLQQEKKAIFVGEYGGKEDVPVHDHSTTGSSCAAGGEEEEQRSKQEDLFLLIENKKAGQHKVHKKSLRSSAALLEVDNDQVHEKVTTTTGTYASAPADEPQGSFHSHRGAGPPLHQASPPPHKKNLHHDEKG
ncbi:hypothetical protein ACA910_022413 [Epithemia clementina (nom. ined.)]